MIQLGQRDRETPDERVQKENVYQLMTAGRFARHDIVEGNEVPILPGPR